MTTGHGIKGPKLAGMRMLRKGSIPELSRTAKALVHLINDNIIIGNQHGKFQGCAYMCNPGPGRDFGTAFEIAQLSSA